MNVYCHPVDKHVTIPLAVLYVLVMMGLYWIAMRGLV